MRRARMVVQLRGDGWRRRGIGRIGEGSAGQEHFWRCVRGEHVRTISTPLNVDFRTLSSADPAKCIKGAFNISGEWDGQ